MKLWTAQTCVGDVFIKHQYALKLYRRYINNYDKSMQEVSIQQRESPEVEFIDEEKDFSIMSSSIWILVYHIVIYLLPILSSLIFPD